MMTIFDSLIDIAILGGQSVMCSVVYMYVYAGSKTQNYNVASCILKSVNAVVF